MADPDLVDLAIERGALTTAGNQFNTTQRDVLHGFDSPAAPFLGLRPTNCIAGVAGRPCTFEEKEGHHFQMFDPATGSVTKLAKTTVSRGLHGTATLLPDATVFFAGENREALVRPDDLSFPLASSYAGILPRGDPDLGVPVGQVFSPAYLFEKGGGRSSRPKIVHAPGEIGYEGHFDLRIADRADEIGSVVLLPQRSQHSQPDDGRSVREAGIRADRSGWQRSGDDAEIPGSGRPRSVFALRRGQERRAEHWPTR
jgi:hypothetical protein